MSRAVFNSLIYSFGLIVLVFYSFTVCVVVYRPVCVVVYRPVCVVVYILGRRWKEDIFTLIYLKLWTHWTITRQRIAFWTFSCRSFLRNVRIFAQRDIVFQLFKNEGLIGHLAHFCLQNWRVSLSCKWHFVKH